VSLAERIDELVARNVVFAAFRIPGERPRAFIQSGQTLHPAHNGRTAWWVAPFGPDPVNVQAILPDHDVWLDDALPALPEAVPPPFRDARPGLDRSGYADAVLQAVEQIRNGMLEKVVLARTMPGLVDIRHWGALFALASERLPQACVALVRTREHGSWLGASPERLLSSIGGRLEVDALAGTMPGLEAPQASSWGAKERAEQLWVTRMVEHTMRQLGVHALEVEGPVVRSAGPVAHLHTVVRGSASGIDVRELALALHPTPAVGGIPRAEALRAIAACEPRQRNLYAGFWGLHTPRRTALYVNIRCMELFPHHALLHVGAGITKDSDPERECQEVERKAATWTDLIATVGSPG
jgi:isochorismate synthase